MELSHRVETVHSGSVTPDHLTSCWRLFHILKLHHPIIDFIFNFHLAHSQSGTMESYSKDEGRIIKPTPTHTVMEDHGSHCNVRERPKSETFKIAATCLIFMVKVSAHGVSGGEHKWQCYGMYQWLRNANTFGPLNIETYSSVSNSKNGSNGGMWHASP